MKFLINKNSLLEAISNVQKAITGKSTLPILQGIYINAYKNTLTLIGSDIDVCIETKVDAEILEEGSIVVDSRLFGEIIRKLPNAEIEICTIDNNTIELNCQKSCVNLIHMDASEYPLLPTITEDTNFSISQKTLKNMIKGTIFAVAQDETRPILTGVLFEVKDRKLNLVALDGFRVAFRSEQLDCDDNKEAVIPGKTLNEVSKILEDKDENVEITFTNNHILFNIGNTKVISRLLEGEFIKYASIIPQEYKTKVIVNKNEILGCIERASLMAKDGNTNLVKLEIIDDNLIVTSNSQLGKAREEMNIILQGESLKIAFNSKYLIDVFKNIEEEEIIMELSSSVAPCVVKNKEVNNCTYLLLPVRVLNN
ncbi:DNA polymerase III subunit beta [Clostridium senegalense]|uniref:DNA polymerase III subunit beta n=1 Tax=Clostridium senegalense TaxID=1465809 RepID=UPI001C0FCE5B|nr:DNA polymerase III subunit beta [Clostridium senegalense]MBU5226709.1 DNA polymerase III subunit beta [Clostridium senegalense]